MVATVTRSATVSRTSSSSSVDYISNGISAAEQRRTRKRITAAQLVQLEELYHRSSHPTRDQRDALAKRIQMEMKSVTIWFQNKRQTDRKVALHNATNSRNVYTPQSSSDNPNITLTTPTSPACPPQTSAPQDEKPKHPSEKTTRKQSTTTRSNTLKRGSSSATSTTSSIASTSSTNSAFRARPSLDRVASRSEIRFTDRTPLRSTSSAMLVRTKGSSGNDSLVTGVTSNSAPLPSQGQGSILTQSDDSVSVPPASPPPSASPPLWTTMLSSPITPSSPPPAEFVTYTRARKIRTLDWACAAARLARDGVFPEDFANFSQASGTSLGPAVLFPEKDMDVCEREYEEATAMTEDEAELITPHGSQDVSMPWAGDAKPVARTCDTTQTMQALHLLHSTDEKNLMGMDEGGWQEDEVHAALALCGLRG